MATRRRDPFPGKDKAASSPKTATSKLKETVQKITRTNVSTAPKKQTRPTLKTTVTNVSKQQVRKPASTPTANKPAQPRTKPLLNNNVAFPKPVRKTQVTSVAVAAPRLPSLTGKTLASPKPVPRKSLKPVTKDEGKRRVSPSVSNVRRSSIGLKKKETATKEQQQITSFTVDKVEDLSIYCVPEPEIQLKDIEYTYLAEVEAEEKLVQRLSNIGSFDVVETEIDQKPLHLAKVGDEIDPTVVISEETPLDIKAQEFECKNNLEEELEQQTKNTTCSNKVEINAHEEAGDQEVKEVKVAAEQQEAAAVVSKAVDETKEIEKPAVEKKKEISFPPKQQERMHGKFDSPVSNNVIEETTTKFLEQNRNRVRALAGAFETVISLQEK